MTTYTITVGSRDFSEFGLGTLYGVYPDFGDPFPPGFGSIAPPGSGVTTFVWSDDGSLVSINSSLPVGSEITWLGQTYVLDNGGGDAIYQGPGLGGTYPTSGTSDFTVAEGLGSITATGEVEISGPVVSGHNFATIEASGEAVIASPVVEGGNLPPVTATGEIVIGLPAVTARGWAVTGSRRVVVLRSGPGTWTVPDDWNASDNRITTIGSAGNGAAGPDIFNGGASGGTGPYMRSTNLAFGLGATYGYDVGPGKHARFGGTSLADCIVGSERGGNASGVTPGTAGLVANSRGDTGVDGTAGTAGGAVGIILNPGAGPGAPGPAGAGAAGQKLLDGAAGGRGGGGAGGLGGGTTTDGHPGNDYGDGVGSGGGGGTGASAVAIRGGPFGGAGPGSPYGWPAGIGDGGAIIISWAPAIVATGSAVVGNPVAEGFAPTRIAQASGECVVPFPVVRGTGEFVPIDVSGTAIVVFPEVSGRIGIVRRPTSSFTLFA